MYKLATILAAFFFAAVPARPGRAADPALVENGVALEPIQEPLPIFDGRAVRLPRADDEFPPLRVLLSRERYWAQDGHMDVVVRLEAPDGVALDASRLLVRLTADGEELSRLSIAPPLHEQFAFYPKLPEGFEGEGRIELIWLAGERTIAEEGRAFRVERFPEPVARDGWVRVSIANPDGVAQDGMPATVGVPFPRGALADPAQLRLLDEGGNEIPMQVKETARWSKFGSVKWALCDFTVDLAGEARELRLEYGPDVRRAERPAISVSDRDGFPVVEAGRLRFDRGLWFDADGDGGHVRVLGEQGLSGAFVEHEDGRFYRMPLADRWVVEEVGPEKVVLRREGWYREEEGGLEFCKYIVRCVIHRDSPLVRFFHTWIYTGDSRRDRIANMGWEFDLPQGFEARGFLSAFGEGGEWVAGDSLVEYDYEHFDLVRSGESREFPGGRAAGVAAVSGDGVRLHFGAKDFWQNYPSELEFRDSSLWFHNWPRHNREAGHTFDKEWITERGEPAASASAARYALEAPDKLTRSEWKLNILQHRYAHEGRILDFSLPWAFGDPPLSWSASVIEETNAQGISRTEEFWVFLTSDGTPVADSAMVLEGLNEERLRGVVDPKWLAQSGAFYEIHHQDWEAFPDEERSYELAAFSFPRLAERLGSYGMWIHGDVPAWNPQAAMRTPSLYRAFQKQHLGWPFSWIPFARSGDSRLLKIAEANTRRIMDAAYCHYVGEEFKDTRRYGYWGIGAVYWGREVPRIRGTQCTVENLLHAWYLTGYRRALEHANFVGSLFKDHPPEIHRFGRATNAELKTYLDIYEATFDPWFLVGAHTLAQGHMHGYSPEFLDGVYGGRLWDTGDRDFLRLTGSREFRDRLYLGRVVPVSLSEWEPTHYNRRSPQYTAKAHAWRLTGDEYYLRRLVNAVQAGTFLVGGGARYPEYLQGYIHRLNEPSPATGGCTDYTIFTGRHLKWFPLALRVLAEEGRRPPPVVNSFTVSPPAWRDEAGYIWRVQVTVMKETEGEPLPLRLRAWRSLWAPTPLSDEVAVDYRVTGPDGEVALSGVWDYADRPHPRGINRKDIAIPPDAPAGVYRVELLYSQAGSVALPLSERDVPEVIEWEEGRQMFGSSAGAFWFKVPQGVERFWVDFRQDDRGVAMVWNPDGRRVWNQGDHWPLEGEEFRGQTVRAEIEVPPEHAGRLWQLSVPGRFAMDPQIPPIFSVSPSRWFDLNE